MAGNIELKFGTSNQSITCTLASLASAAARASTAIDNTTNVFEDLLVQLTLASAASGVSATGIVNIYATGTADGGTSYGESATGTDAAITLTSPTNLKLIGALNVVASSKTYVSSPMSVAAIFGGVVPDHVVIVVQNLSGAALVSGSLKYQGVQHQYT